MADISIKQLADQIFEIQKAESGLETLNADEVEVNIPRLIADLHKRLSDAYSSYETALAEGRDLSAISWRDIESIFESVDGHGLPEGFSVDLGVVIFGALALMKYVGAEPGDILSKMAKAQAEYVGMLDEDFDEEEEIDDGSMDAIPKEDDSMTSTSESNLSKEKVSGASKDQAPQKS
jgi:hypothetical protein